MFVKSNVSTITMPQETLQNFLPVASLTSRISRKTCAYFACSDGKYKGILEIKN